MTLLNRYLFKMFTKNLLLVLSSFAGIYLLIDFFERIDNFLQKKLPLSLAAKYFLCKLPLICEQLMPVSIMLAGIISLGLLHHNRELLSLQAVGISIPRIIRPVLVAGFFFTLLSLGSSQWLLPATQSEVNRIWFQDVNTLIPTGLLRVGMIYYRGKEGFYTMGLTGWNDPTSYVPFSYLKWNDTYDFQMQYSARKAKWHDGEWELTDGMKKESSPTGPLIESFRQKLVSLPENPSDLLVSPYKEEELSLSRLFDRMRSSDKIERKNAGQRFHEKVSYIFLGIPLLFIGLPLMLHICETRGKDLSIAIPASCLVAFLAWGGWGVLQSLSKNQYLPYLPAAWMLHIVVGGLGSYWLFKYFK